MDSKKGIFVIIFIILLVPLIQMYMHFVSGDGLDGYFDNAKDVDFSWDGWFDGSFQNKKDSFYNDNVGFRPALVRVNNQIEYALYHKISGGGTLGKNHCLFYDDYIYGYLGLDYLGYPVIHEELRKLKAVQDTLARLGKSLMLVYAPCKAFYYPEFIPDRFMTLYTGTNNFNTFLRVGDSLGINQVDLNSWFISMKGKSKELLYPRAGTHWSVYGSLLGGDSILKYIEQSRHIHMSHPIWTKTEHVINARDTDDDILKVANLMFPVADEVYCYPRVVYNSDSSDTSVRKPKAIFIGDSFVTNWLRNGFIKNEFSDWQFWSYFKVLVTKDIPFQKNQSPGQNDYWKAELNKTDCVIIMYTAHTLTQKFNGFVDKAYEYYYPENR